MSKPYFYDIAECSDQADNKELINTRLFRIVKDPNLFRPFVKDITLYLYGIMVLFAILMELLGRTLSSIHLEVMYSLFITFIAIGIFIHMNLIKDYRTYISVKIHNKKLKLAFPYIILLVSLILLLIPSWIFVRFDLIEYDRLQYNFIVASWE